MKCSICGHVPDSHVRFCPNCQSYFVDADDPKAGIMWKGIMDENGNITAQPDIHNPVMNADLPHRGLAVAGFVLSCVNLFFVLIGAFIIEDLMVLGIPLFVLALIFFLKTAKHRISMLNLLGLIISFILFFWRFSL